MTYEDIILIVIAAVFGKIVTDSLPDIGIKSIWNLVKKTGRIIFKILAPAILLILFVFKLLDKETENRLITLMILLIIVAIYMQIEKKQKDSTSITP